MRFCSVVGCNNGSTGACGVSFHRFPADAEKRKQWQMRINRLNVKTGKLWEPGKYSYVCAEHFTADDFELCMNITRLKCDAVPSVFNYDKIPSIRKRLMHNGKICLPSSVKISSDVVPVGLFTSAKASETMSEDISIVKIEPCDITLQTESCSVLFWKDQCNQVSSMKLPSSVVSENLQGVLLKLPTYFKSESVSISKDDLITIPSSVRSENLKEDDISKLPSNVTTVNHSEFITSQNLNSSTLSKSPSVIASENLRKDAISTLPRIIKVENLSDSTTSVHTRFITSQNLTDVAASKLSSFVVPEVVADNAITADNSGLLMSVEQSINITSTEDIDAELEGNPKIDPEIASNRHVLNENIKQIKLIHNYCTTESPGKLKKRNFRLVEALEKKTRLIKTLRQSQSRMREMTNVLLKKLHEQQMELVQFRKIS